VWPHEQINYPGRYFIVKVIHDTLVSFGHSDIQRTVYRDIFL